MIRFACPACKNVLAAEDEHVGFPISCPNCTQAVIVPPPAQGVPVMGIALPETSAQVLEEITVTAPPAALVPSVFPREARTDLTGDNGDEADEPWDLPDYRPRKSFKPFLFVTFLLLLCGGAVAGLLYYWSKLPQRLASADKTTAKTTEVGKKERPARTGAEKNNTGEVEDDRKWIKDALEEEVRHLKPSAPRETAEPPDIGPAPAKARGPAAKGPKSQTTRDQRRQRWSMNFNASTGVEYLRQLGALGAFLGVPDRRGKLMLIRDLAERPAKPKYEDIRDLNRIYWVDDRADSVRAVAEALNLDAVPSELFAFFPTEIEEQLVAVELAYGKKFGRNTEADIKETEFYVSFRAGKPVFTVKHQKGLAP